ncbi:MAG TPA: V-type ATP synthase subunit E [bacterium]|jgi:vacuolar-type H+-ATPase subunit E/Vma4|nr:V-type ATP synthase subunit E [bacterium]
MGADLIALLEQEAGAERERLLGEARRQAEEIRAATRAEAQALMERTREQQEAALRAAQVRARSTAQLQAQALVLERKDQALAEVFRRATEALEALVRDRARYGHVLERLIAEAAAGFSGRVLIETHPDDVELVREAARRHKLDADVRGTNEIRGGVRLSSPDGRYVVVNTLAARLERARPTLGSDVARALWG